MTLSLSLHLTTHPERSVLVFVGPPHDKDAKEHHAIEDPHGSTEPTNQWLNIAQQQQDRGHKWL